LMIVFDPFFDCGDGVLLVFELEGQVPQDFLLLGEHAEQFLFYF
jgi:hypothetical protein